MPLIKGKSEKSFKKNVETEMDAGKPQAQSLAIAYAMKRKAKKMAHGGEMEPADSDSASMKQAEMHADLDNGADPEPGMDHEDMVSRIMAKRMSKGGMVANEDHGHMDEDLAGFDQNEFDDLALRDDLGQHYTGANSGDELGDAQEDADRKDVVARIMRSRAKKDRLPNPR